MGAFLRRGLPIAIGATLLRGLAARADDIPSPEMLDAMFPSLRHKTTPGPPTGRAFSRSSNRVVDAACGLIPIDLTQTTRSDQRIFKLLGQPKSDTDSQPVSMLVRLSRMTVNADGSRRAYHPNDPFGLCNGNASGKLPNACALDVLGDAEIRVYRGAERIRQFKVPEGQTKPAPNPAFAEVWNGLCRRLRRARIAGLICERSSANKPRRISGCIIQRRLTAPSFSIPISFRSRALIRVNIATKWTSILLRQPQSRAQAVSWPAAAGRP